MTDIMLDGAGGVVPVRAPKLRPWNAATKRRFLELLAELSSVRAALAQMGMTAHALYETRKRCKWFRAAWDEVIEFGFARLEAELLDRALNGYEREVFGPSGEKTTLREMANALGLALLKLAAPRLAAIRALHGPDAEDDAMQAKIEIIKKLEMLAKHKAKRAAEAAQAPPPV